MLNFLHIVVSLVILLRTVCYQKPPGASYKPVMSALAYLLIIAAGYDIVTVLFSGGDYPVSSLIFKTLLAAALINSRGNVVDLFITRYQALRFVHWYREKYARFTKPVKKIPAMNIPQRRKTDDGGKHA
ncbi:phage holin family protein [Methylophilus sp. QUAN]|uniref:phage holin family protein n=1 Tax=Methylophilus sp. QUAN TaxID=2781020 RepID=UPI00188EA085|nr:phage holin family protein [Methylophilus sp. QUAN]MBF4990694.1 phage holin family protein [Methylophilus sp. QUAN]